MVAWVADGEVWYFRRWSVAGLAHAWRRGAPRRADALQFGELPQHFLKLLPHGAHRAGALKFGRIRHEGAEFPARAAQGFLHPVEPLRPHMDP
jgi:hypothetical protein